MKTRTLLLSLAGLGLFFTSCDSITTCEVERSDEDLTFTQLATTWDEGIPLGNAEVGALVWQKNNALRLSLDRTDLWDLRPSENMAGPH